MWVIWLADEWIASQGLCSAMQFATQQNNASVTNRSGRWCNTVKIKLVYSYNRFTQYIRAAKWYAYITLLIHVLTSKHRMSVVYNMPSLTSTEMRCTNVRNFSVRFCTKHFLTFILRRTSPCTMGTGSFPGVKSGRGVTLTPHPLLVPWSWKDRAIPLLPLWAVRPAQSLSACTRVHFTGRTACTEPQCLYRGELYLFYSLRKIQGGSNMTGTDLYKRTHKSVSVIFVSPCTFHMCTGWQAAEGRFCHTKHSILSLRSALHLPFQRPQKLTEL